MPYRPPTSQSAIVSALEPPLPTPRTPQIHRILTVLTRLGLLSHLPHPVFEMTRLQSALFRRNVHKRILFIYESLSYLIPLGFVTSSFRPSGSPRGVGININKNAKTRSLYETTRAPIFFLVANQTRITLLLASF